MSCRVVSGVSSFFSQRGSICTSSKHSCQLNSSVKGCTAHFVPANWRPFLLISRSRNLQVAVNFTGFRYPWHSFHVCLHQWYSSSHLLSSHLQVISRHLCPNLLVIGFSRMFNTSHKRSKYCDCWYRSLAGSMFSGRFHQTCLQALSSICCCLLFSFLFLTDWCNRSSVTLFYRMNPPNCAEM